MTNKEYRFFNILFVGFFIVGGFLFATHTVDEIIQCQVLKTSGEPCSSCGLTRDFTSFFNFNFDDRINQNSLPIFIWFVIQFLFRTIVSLGQLNNSSTKKWDLSLSLISGLLLFLPFWM